MKEVLNTRSSSKEKAFVILTLCFCLLLTSDPKLIPSWTASGLSITTIISPVTTVRKLLTVSSSYSFS